MTCEPKPTDSAHHEQGGAGGGGGGPLGDRDFPAAEAVYRLALIEGDPIEPDEPDPKVVEDTRTLFNNLHPGFDDAKLDLLVEFERNLEDLERRLDIALKIRAAVRRQSLRLLGGGKR